LQLSRQLHGNFQAKTKYVISNFRRESQNFLKCNQEIDDMSDVSVSGDNKEYCVEVDDNLEDLSDDDYMSEECLKTQL
jgi:hypothetical protein